MGEEIILSVDGDVEVFDPRDIEHELESLRQPGYYDLHCAPKGSHCCDSCKELACPVFG